MPEGIKQVNISINSCDRGTALRSIQSVVSSLEESFGETLTEGDTYFIKDLYDSVTNQEFQSKDPILKQEIKIYRGWTCGAGLIMQWRTSKSDEVLIQTQTVAKIEDVLMKLCLWPSMLGVAIIVVLYQILYMGILNRIVLLGGFLGLLAGGILGAIIYYALAQPFVKAAKSKKDEDSKWLAEFLEKLAIAKINSEWGNVNSGSE